jgi:hypothetical protein
MAGKGTCVRSAIGEKYEYANGNKHGYGITLWTKALAMRCAFCEYTLVYKSLFIFHPSLAHLLHVFPITVQSFVHMHGLIISM